MGWGSTKNRSMPCIASYAMVKEKWERINPIRGHRETSDKPLHDRNDRQRWIGMRGAVFAARLYGTDVVSYHPDGKVTLRTEGWHSHATADFMNAVSPVQAQLFDGKVWASMNGKHYIVNNTLEIIKDENGKWQPINPTPTVTYRLNKEKAKAIRTSFKPFLEYAKAMFKLQDVKPRGFKRGTFDVADEGTYYDLYAQIVGDTFEEFRRNLWRWAYRAYGAYDTIEVPLGEMVAKWK